LPDKIRGRLTHLLDIIEDDDECLLLEPVGELLSGFGDRCQLLKLQIEKFPELNNELTRGARCPKTSEVHITALFTQMSPEFIGQSSLSDSRRSDNRDEALAV
jgi:hypothetical protein